MTGVDRVAGLAVAALTTLGLAWLSQVPVASGGSADALLRLAWRARPERIERCVEQSPEALAALPPHMRQQTICEGVNASYYLAVQHDGKVVAEQHVRPGGLRRDRPLYVFLEIPLSTGEATIRISFTRAEETSSNGQTDDSRDRLREAVPAALVWEERLNFAPGQVRLVSYDPERRTLFEVRPE